MLSGVVDLSSVDFSSVVYGNTLGLQYVGYPLPSLTPLRVCYYSFIPLGMLLLYPCTFSCFYSFVLCPIRVVYSCIRVPQYLRCIFLYL